MMHFAQSLTLFYCILLFWPLSVLSQAFEDDLESYDVGEIATWSDGAGVLVVDQATIPLLGNPNRALSMQQKSLRMMQDVRSITKGHVSTLAVDFIDLTEGYSKLGLAIGFGNGPDLTSVTSSANILLLNGEIVHDRIGGMSHLGHLGPSRYELGLDYRLYLVVNDTDQELVRYEGLENLAPRSYEVWIGPRGGSIWPVLEASIARPPQYAGFRSWSDTDMDVYADNIVVSRGIGLSETHFEEDFEGYSKGSAAKWDSSSGGAIVTQDSVDDFGSPNKSLHITGDEISLTKNIGSGTVDAVSTLSLMFIERPGDGSGSVKIGLFDQTNLNSGPVAAVELLNGKVLHSARGNVTEQGIADYPTGKLNHLYIVANDSSEPLIDYYGQEDLEPGKFEVWLLTGDGMFVRVLEGTMPGDPRYLGIHTDGDDTGFYIDDIDVKGGVRMIGGRSLVELTPETPGAAAGVPFGLAYTVNAPLPTGSTYEITSNGDVSFPNGGTSGPAAMAGAFDAVINSGHRSNVTFTITIRNAQGAAIARSSASVMVFDYRTEPELPHPSVINTQEQLDRMRAVVRNEISSIARAGWDAMLQTEYASLSYSHTPWETIEVVPAHTGPSEDDFRNDGTAARSHALQWVVTGNPAHRDKALAILNDWGRTFRKIESSNPAQVHLEAAWALPVWISAADIMRYHNGGASNWHPTDMAAFNYFMEILYQEASSALDERNNWAVSAALAVMSYGAWSDEQSIFQVGLDYQLRKLDELSQTSGEIVETCRDTWHSQYSVVSWGDSAELAHNLGYDDLYEATFDGQSIPRLAIILEYFANLMTGRKEAPCGSEWSYDYEGEYSRFDNYETPYNHYINRKSANYLPVFKEMVEEHWRDAVGEDAHFFLWSRLTHGADSIDVSYQSPAGKGILLPFTVEEARWIDTRGWLGWVNDAFYPWLFVNAGGWIFVNEAGPADTRAGAWAFLRNDGALVPANNSGAGTWAGATMDEAGNVDTGMLAGWIIVPDASGWIFSWSFLNWLYLPETHVTPTGAWAYIAG